MTSSGSTAPMPDEPDDQVRDQTEDLTTDGPGGDTATSPQDLADDWKDDGTTGPGWPALLAAEAFGTFVLVLAGVGVAIYAGLSGIGGGPLAVALAFGLALAVGIAAVGRVSGGYFNPAVTLGAVIAGRLPLVRLLPYWGAQVIGGLGGALIAFVAVPTALPTAVSGSATSVRTYFSDASNGFDTSASETHSPLGRVASQVMTGPASAFLIEAVLTAVFVGVILAVTHRRANPQLAPFAIGGTLAVLVLIALPLTNAGLNPARSLATAVFSESWALKQIWLFWAAPLVGALVAGLVARVFESRQVETPFDEDDDADIVDEIEVIVG
ncbi:MAG: aquaporin [Actinobacteria bacterium]|nr:aquaporin [Actinomycetota bacterium]MCG2797113.1 aquaporin [Cellulomonas sp.]